MNYAQIKPFDIADGEGVRVGFYVSGCARHCPGCHNPEAQSFDYGELYTDDVEDKIIELLRPRYIQGLSILGGEPFEPDNIETVEKLILRVREEYGTLKDIWIYTGYCMEDLMRLPSDPYTAVLTLSDVIVDGPFELDKRDPALAFKGSSNQRIINIENYMKLYYDWN